MTNTTNTFEIELKDLETVSGGTVGEFDDILQWLANNDHFVEASGMFFGHVPGANNGIASYVEWYLDYYYDIKADISLGFASRIWYERDYI